MDEINNIIFLLIFIISYYQLLFLHICYRNYKAICIYIFYKNYIRRFSLA